MPELGARTGRADRRQFSSRGCEALERSSWCSLRLLVEVFKVNTPVQSREALHGRLPRTGFNSSSWSCCSWCCSRSFPKEEFLSGGGEQRHPKEWAVTIDPYGRTYFWHRRSRRVRWTLPPASVGTQEEKKRRKQKEQATAWLPSIARIDLVPRVFRDTQPPSYRPWKASFVFYACPCLACAFRALIGSRSHSGYAVSSASSRCQASVVSSLSVFSSGLWVVCDMKNKFLVTFVDAQKFFES